MAGPAVDPLQGKDREKCMISTIELPKEIGLSTNT